MTSAQRSRAYQALWARIVAAGNHPTILSRAEFGIILGAFGRNIRVRFQPTPLFEGSPISLSTFYRSDQDIIDRWSDLWVKL